MEFPRIPISDESLFPLDSSSLILGGVELSHTISARSSTSRDKVVKRQTVSRHSTSKGTRNFNSAVLKLHTRNVGAHGPRLLTYYGGNTLDAQTRTMKKIEEYRELHNQSPITPIGPQGPRGGESQLHWQCNICGRDFDTFQKAAVHLTSCEWGLANWQCLEIACDRVYQSRNELVRHKTTSHPNARPDEYEDTNAATSPRIASPPSTRLPIGPLYSQTTPISQISDYPFQGEVTSQRPVALTSASLIAVPPAPPARMYDQHTRASSAMPNSQHHSFDSWSLPHVEKSHRFIPNSSQNTGGDVTALPTMRGPVTYETPSEYPPHRTQTVGSNGQWLYASHGLTGLPEVSSRVIDTSALFRTPLGSSNGILTTPYSSSQLSIPFFHSQGDLVNNYGLHQPSSQSPHPLLTPASPSYFMNSFPRNPATDVRYAQQDRPLQQVQTPDRDTRKYPSLSDAWLHHDSELKEVAIYHSAAATSRQSSYPANIPITDRPGRFLSTNNGGNYVQEKFYGHQMDIT